MFESTDDLGLLDWTLELVLALFCDLPARSLLEAAGAPSFLLEGLEQ